MRRLLVYASAITIGMSGCVSTASFYSSPAVHAPLLYREGQGTVDAALGVGIGQYSSSAVADLSAAYSPIKHVAVTGNYHWFNSSYGQGYTTPDNQDNNARMGDIAVGGYWASDDPKIKLIADVFGGGGFGKLTSNGIMNGSMNMTRIFLQPGIGLRTNIVDLAFNLRVSGLSYNYTSPAIGFAPNNLNYSEIPPVNGSFNIFAEPALTIRLGYKFVKLHTQMIFARSNAYWNYDGFVMNFGLHFNLEYLQHGFYAKQEQNTRDTQSGM